MIFTSYTCCAIQGWKNPVLLNSNSIYEQKHVHKMQFYSWSSSYVPNASGKDVLFDTIMYWLKTSAWFFPWISENLWLFFVMFWFFWYFGYSNYSFEQKMEKTSKAFIWKFSKEFVLFEFAKQPIQHSMRLPHIKVAFLYSHSIIIQIRQTKTSLTIN